MSSLASFSADWLRQREPFDAAARNRAAGPLNLSRHLKAWRPPADLPWRVIDLACGAGANLRWLAPHLGGDQEWLMVDHDPDLLGRIPPSLSGPGYRASTVRQPCDLALELEALPWHAAHLVTASALLDLVSLAWLQRLVAQASSARVALLFALSVDGRHDWAPADPDDAQVGRLFHAHQGRDKGFGPALGAGAIDAFERALRGSGYQVISARSEWVLQGARSPAAAALQRSLVEGMAAAACEQDPATATGVWAWQARRLKSVTRSCLRVGHVDLLALPPAH